VTTTAGPSNADAPPGAVRVRAFLPLDRRRSPLSAALSFAIHVGIILLLVRFGVREATTRGNPLTSLFDQQPGGGGGGGTGGVAFIAIPPPPPPPPEEIIVPPAVVPTVVPPVDPEPEIEPVPTPPPPAPDTVPAGPPGGTQGSGGGSGGGQGTGTGPGTGSGVGPGSGGGSGGGTGGGGQRGSPPQARQLILPPLDGVPKSLRGTSVLVTFRIDAEGRVSDLDVAPPISDRGFARKFDETMRGYRFRPARDANGVAVPGLLPLTVTWPER
jgi:protein TonB